MAKIYQVFVGCPFSRDVRRTYDRFKREVEAETPLSVVLADTVGVTSSDYLLEHITELIRESAGCVFDATGANPNVSLEVGIAHAIPVQFLLTLKTRKKRKGSRKDTEVRSIISDLQGRNRIEYKVFDTLKQQLFERYLQSLPYMQRWLRFERDHQSLAPLVLPLFADMRSSGRSSRPRLQALLDGTGFSPSEAVAALTRNKLLVAKRGPGGGYFYPTK
ncbi:MAG: hypothetical protein ACREK5_10580 [Gemmatimonadota bacterium]